MKLHRVLAQVAVLMAAAVLPATALAAEADAALKARMEKRQPEIRALMNKQQIGENNRGYVEVRGSAAHEVQQVVADENSDRLKLYTALAAETGEKVEEIGRQRAADAALQARRGHWIQDRSGDWRQK